MQTKRFRAVQYHAAKRSEVQDLLVVEAPLHLRVNGSAYTTTMRTPGDDELLARGLVFTEGIIEHANIPIGFRPIPDPESGLTACLDMQIDSNRIVKPVEGRRSLISASSCGVCGTREPADLQIQGPALRIRRDLRLSLERVSYMMERMSEHQTTFERSGGSHAAAAYDADGTLRDVREDIGRHNAVDKVIGALAVENTLDRATVLAVSGRLSYEIVFKAYRAAMPIILAVSAPSSMAVETAQRFGMTILAFCRQDRTTIYSHPENVVAHESEGAAPNTSKGSATT